MSGTEVRFGLIGAGKVAGQYLAPALAAATNACLWSVLGRDPERTRSFADNHRAAAPEPDFVTLSAFLSDPNLDAVIIATPELSHADLAISVLNSGRPVLIEKPLAATSNQGWTISDAAARTRLPVSVGYHMRHHAGLRVLVDRVHQGALGAPLHMAVRWTQRSSQGPSHWRANRTAAPWWSIGAFGTHAVDLIRWFFVPLCGEIVDVHGFANNAIWNSDNDESANVVFRFSSGATAEMTVSVLWDSPNCIEIWGDSASAVALDTLGARGTGTIQLGNETILFDAVDPYLTEIEHFSGCITNGWRPRVSLIEALRNVQILETMSGTARPEINQE